MGDDFYAVTTAATDDPLSLEEVKNFLRIDDDIKDDDALIQGLIRAVVIDGEKFTNRCFVERTFNGKFQQLETSEFEDWPYIQIRRAPIVSITSVKAMFNDSLVDVPAADFQLKESSGFSRIIFIDPDISVDDVPFPLEVVFVAGYGEPQDVPEAIKEALKQHILFLYENRGDVDTEGKLSMPRVTSAIYKGNYRILNTYG